jgi:exonuclease SbcC
MRPLTLSIHGLTAFRDQPEIDLTGLDLFVITGPTGAGKTSILDAITFALYGDVVRVKSGELKHLISHGMPDMRVALDFSVHGRRYRVVRSLKRDNRPQAGHLEELVGEEYVPLLTETGIKPLNERVKELIGLDFEGFTRAVILPQGKFQEFLSGEPSQRRQILSSLLVLDQYERMGQLARNQANTLKTQIEGHERRLAEDFAEATPENVRAKSQDLKLADRRARELDELIRRSREIAVSAGGFEQDSTRIASLLEPVHAFLQQADALREELETLDRDRAACSQACDEAESALKAAQSARREAEQTVATLISGHGDEATLTTHRNAATVLAEESKKLAVAQADLKRLRQERAAAADAKTEAEAAAKLVLEERTALQQAQSLAAADLELAEHLLEYANCRAEMEELAGALTHVNARLTEAGEARDRARATLDHLRTQHTAAGLRAALKPGDACPVCEQPVVSIPETDARLTRAIGEAESALRAAEAGQSDAQSQASAVRAQHGQLSIAVAKLAESVQLVDREISVESATGRRDQARAALKNATAAVEATGTRAAQAADTLDRAKLTFAGLDHRLDSGGRSVNDLIQRVERAAAILEPYGTTLTPDELAEKIAGLISGLRAAQETARTAVQACEKAQSDRDRARAVLVRVNERSLRSEGQVALHWGRLGDAQKSLVGALARSFEKVLAPAEEPLTTSLATLAEVAEALTEAAGAELQRLAEGTEEVRRRLLDLAQSVGIDAEGLDAAAIAARLEDEVKAASAAYHRLDVEINGLRQQQSRRATIEAEIQRSRERSDLLQTVASELRADHFIRWVQRASMRSLAAMATEELRQLSSDRYSLGATEDGAFEVVDNDNAQERRSVATLSGGETFLASLALALALSGSVRDLAGNAAAARLESMFIDEGFGSLDSETLDTAIQALERLSHRDRMIGVISHVGSLAEHIPAGLRVSKVGASSKIDRRDAA